MNEKQCNKLTLNANVVSKQVIELATYVVDHDCTTMDKKPIIGDERKNLIEVMSMDIGYGEKLAKNKYLLTGIFIGATVMVGVFTIREIIKKNYKKES